MKRTQSNKLREFVFISMTIFVVVVLIFGGIEGKRQDNVNLEDYIKFKKAEEFYNQGNYDEASLLYLELIQKEKYQNSVAINWGIAQILKHRGKHAEALEYFDRIRDYYPAIVNNQVYLEEYLGALTMVGDERVEIYQK